MHNATDITVRMSLGGIRGERRMLRWAAVFWAFMLIILPLGIILAGSFS